ncbi:phosphotransferase family protein [Streptomyces sp. NBRC 109706]|uniref:phosphotransferase family protein n=1 Tax=Streptomyces sp. NBRC 109706 TaxID=1550035 RepID=UPI0007853C5F|nr:aminoglycoside phosphotransferase family protein [Streptomyces sp. NBRC 109706]
MPPPDRDPVTRLLDRAGLPTDIREARPLGGGTYNTLRRLTLADGRVLIAKLPPPSEAPAMTYERGLLRGEAEFYRIAGEHHAAPVPEVVFFDAADPSGMLMTERPGRPWNEAGTALDADTTAELRRQLGSCVARLHRIPGPRFGYPGGAIPMADGWREAFTTMLAALLHDAERYRAPLPHPLARIRTLTTAAAPALDEVGTPAPVHFDLWQGNVLLHNGEISALIDGERLFWGDPLAELVSLNLLADPLGDPDLLAGYTSAGGTLPTDDTALARLALYQVYLYLIMLTEGAPRAYPRRQLEWAQDTVAPQLDAALTTLAELTS